MWNHANPQFTANYTPVPRRARRLEFTLTHSVYVPPEFFLENLSIGPYFKELLALGNYLGVLKTQIGFISK